MVDVVCRNAHGLVLFSWSKRLPPCGSLVGEARAALFAVREASFLSNGSFIFEGDSKLVIDAINSDSGLVDWQIRPLIADSLIFIVYGAFALPGLFFMYGVMPIVLRMNLLSGLLLRTWRGFYPPLASLFRSSPVITPGFPHDVIWEVWCFCSLLRKKKAIEKTKTIYSQSKKLNNLVRSMKALRLHLLVLLVTHILQGCLPFPSNIPHMNLLAIKVYYKELPID
ncbi:hypothetical protein CJ030_MR7G016795 [Morella rubra]|uniref:RNase H type-1 domain-containing protein n=1 Tax=Morella rubra TaxID=262757 RepID=A0A6A1UXW1_9ROSI|nr:hypothetical protein CJ030_MR7G016795 [Morella rubra]